MTKGRYWRFWRQRELGLMYGPIPIAMVFMIVSTVVLFIYAYVILE